MNAPQLQRLVIETKPEELAIRVLYRSKGMRTPARMRAKTEHYRAAAEMGFDPGEAALMRLRGLWAAPEEAAT